MHLQSIVPILLVLAIAFSWARFARIFRTEAGLGGPTAPTGMIAGTVCTCGLGLALADNGLLPGLLIVAVGLLVAHAARALRTGLAVMLAVLSLAGYLESRAAMDHEANIRMSYEIISAAPVEYRPAWRMAFTKSDPHARN